ncbi:oxidoreductase [Amycolatopsis sp. NPDC059657]|uniref:oxidoreductase n=1 Tax=Amycolatopsis sp. NPDC059657 TaxID=3346899 RepID=UPI0036721986
MIEASELLADPRFTLPPVFSGAPGTVGWLRANVARFSTGQAHTRRRSLVMEELAGVDPARLRREAFDRTVEAKNSGPVDLEVIVVETLAAALGLPAGLSADIAIVAKVYQPHVEATSVEDAAVARLAEACGGASEHTAARIGLLVQACDATAGLVENALGETVAAEEALAVTLRERPPVSVTRRYKDGHVVEVDLAGLPFGHGPKACPGQAHALAIASGILDATRRSVC